MNIQDIISSFKEHQLQYGLNGDNNQQELYKWELITKQAGLLDPEAENFEEGIRKLNFINLCFFSQMTAFRNLAKYETENYRNAMRELLNESVDLQERISQFKSTCDSLWDNSVKNNFEGKTSAMCDERIISCFLTLKYPQKYTFYKDRDLYEPLCEILGVEKRKTGKKLSHYYELINQIIPEIEKDKELLDSINNELDIKGYIHSMPLIAQTILWCNACKNKIGENHNAVAEVKALTQTTNAKPMKEIEILKQKKQIILQGAPGTGKTYKTAEIAVKLCDPDFASVNREELMKRYKELVLEKRIAFTTFHQSMDYEEFVEGIKPITEDGEVNYEVRKGIFRQICDEAIDSQRDKKYDNFKEVWDSLIEYLNEDDKFIDVPLLKGNKTMKVVLNEPGTGLTNRTYQEGDNTKWIKGKSKFFNKEQLYNVYRGFPGIPSGGHDNYRKAIINHLKKEFKLVEFKKEEKKTNKEQNYVLIIDEINRANISKVLGELITLLEADKRIGETNEVKVKLPYSGEEFGVPNNLYIIGTMNTADRSVGYIDYAIRRRFAFITVRADDTIIKNPTARSYFEKVKGWMKKDNIIGDIEPEDLMVGHSYFLAEDEEKLKNKMLYEVIPLLREYISDGILNADIRDEIKNWEKELDPEKNN